MTEIENRQIARDSLFLMADLRIDGLDGEYREGGIQVMRGTLVAVNIRNIGWVAGSVAWVQENRFGVAFTEEIDPKLARAAVTPVPDDKPNFVRTYEAQYSPPTTPAKNLRKL
jgi:hypothetical protein